MHAFIKSANPRQVGICVRCGMSKEHPHHTTDPDTQQEAREAMTEIRFTRVPITGTIGCGVPVLPGTPDADAPLEDRTELCAVDAHWIIGMVPTCDHHARLVCSMTDIDWPGVLAEVERDPGSAEQPWADRMRHPQVDARKHLAHFTAEATEREQTMRARWEAERAIFIASGEDDIGEFDDADELPPSEGLTREQAADVERAGFRAALAARSTTPPLSDAYVWAVGEHLRRIEGEAAVAPGEWARTIRSIAREALRELESAARSTTPSDREALIEVKRAIERPESTAAEDIQLVADILRPIFAAATPSDENAGEFDENNVREHKASFEDGYAAGKHAGIIEAARQPPCKLCGGKGYRRQSGGSFTEPCGCFAAASPSTETTGSE